MIELPVTLTSTGGAVSFASPVTLGYTKTEACIVCLSLPKASGKV